MRRSDPTDSEYKRIRGGRAATLVEYSMIVALVCLALIAAVDAVSSPAEDRLGDRGQAIGNPVEPGATTSTTTSGSTSSTSSTTTTTIPYEVAVTTACTGSNGFKNQCTFALTPAPPSGAVVVWAIEPPEGYTGVPPSVTFTDDGKRTVQASVDGQDADPITVHCKESGNPKILQC